MKNTDSPHLFYLEPCEYPSSSLEIQEPNITKNANQPTPKENYIIPNHPKLTGVS